MLRFPVPETIRTSATGKVSSRPTVPWVNYCLPHWQERLKSGILLSDTPLWDISDPFLWDFRGTINVFPFAKNKVHMKTRENYKSFWIYEHHSFPFLLFTESSFPSQGDVCFVIYRGCVCVPISYMKTKDGKFTYITNQRTFMVVFTGFSKGSIHGPVYVLYFNSLFNLTRRTKFLTVTYSFSNFLYVKGK